MAHRYFCSCNFGDNTSLVVFDIARPFSSLNFCVERVALDWVSFAANFCPLIVAI
jgi:hypothetical protein